MNLTTFSLKRPVTTLMLFASVMLIGGIGGKLLPLAYFPDMEFPAVLIEVPYPSSTPEEVERLITRPIEEALATMSGVVSMYSTSHEQGAQLFLRFDWGQDVSTISIEAKEKIDGIRYLLPDDVERIFIRKFSTADEPILNYRISSTRDLSNSYDMLVRNLVRRTERINGVSKVELYGIEKQEIQIDLKIDKVVAQGIDPAALLNDLRNSHFLVTAGRVTDGNRRFIVRPLGELANAAELADLPVGDGTLRLGDIATITYVNPILDYGRHLDRKYAVGLDIFKESGTHTVAVANAVIAEVEKISKLPEMDGITILFLDNQAAGIVSSITELLKSGLIGAMLAMIVLYYFLRNFMTTFIVALAVPSSLMAALGVMYFAGISLNILSMMGLMLAVGMLVDNAVVVTENIHRHQKLTGYTDKSIFAGVREVALAVGAGTFTTAIVFLPNILSQDNPISIQLSHVAIPIVISLAASLLISQTVVPLMASKIKLKGGKPKPQRVGIDKLQALHARILNWTLDHHRATIGLIFLLLAATAIPIKIVKKEMFEDATSKRLRLNYYINASYDLEKIERAVDKIEDYLFANKEEFEIKSVYSYYTPDYANSTIYLTDDKLQRSLEEIKESIQEGMPSLTVGKPSLERNRSGGAEDIGLQLSGKSSERLVELTIEVAALLERVEGFGTVRSDAEAGGKEVHVIINRERANHFGFSNELIAQTIAAAMRGINLPKLCDDEGEVTVRLNLERRDNRTMNTLMNLPIYQPLTGKPIKLSAIADFRIRNGPRSIRRENRITSLGLKANVDGLTTDEAREKMEEIMELYQLPPGYTWGYGSSFDFENEAAKTMLINTLLALALIYFVMAALFESLVFPAAIWSSILFAIVGVWWFFLITGTTFSIMAWIGILILMAVVVNNGIVLIDRVNQLRDEGMDRREAILQGGHDRLRAILMTAATTVLGLIPLAMTNTQIGGDGPPYAPMARAIVGGLTFSTVVTLVILPTIYIVLDDMRIWGRRILQLSKIKR